MSTDFELYRQRKGAGKQAYYSSRRYSRRGRGGANVAGVQPVESESSSKPSTRERSNRPHPVDLIEDDDVNYDQNKEDRQLLKRISAELLQSDRMSSTSINASLKELDALIPKGTGLSIDLEALAESLSTLPTHTRLQIPEFCFDGVHLNADVESDDYLDDSADSDLCSWINPLPVQAAMLQVPLAASALSAPSTSVSATSSLPLPRVSPYISPAARQMSVQQPHGNQQQSDEPTQSCISSSQIVLPASSANSMEIAQSQLISAPHPAVQSLSAAAAISSPPSIQQLQPLSKTTLPASSVPVTTSVPSKPIIRDADDDDLDALLSGDSTTPSAPKPNILPSKHLPTSTAASISLNKRSQVGIPLLATASKPIATHMAPSTKPAASAKSSSAQMDDDLDALLND